MYMFKIYSILGFIFSFVSFCKATGPKSEEKENKSYVLKKEDLDNFKTQLSEENS